MTDRIIDEPGTPAEKIAYELCKELTEHFHTKRELLDALQGAINRIEVIEEEEEE